ncbi:AAA family ATPase [Desertihabitans brevis]|uniref:AAA family ATPase n=1 Tax=Desertihabitans brevis TaxID=2268447 RepID=A0A367YU46_9ACTN|nr:AAA family ATPase [Desertihabitans brevis]RCK69415.1 AAA family ATPase [Desertihabitans brevis]
MSWTSPLPVRRVEVDPEAVHDDWPFDLPPVAQLVREGLDLGPLTVLVGENGTGKSTLVEAVAMAYGLSPEGGSTGARHTTTPTESPLHGALRLSRGAGASRWGYFVRAETLHGLNSYLQHNPGAEDAGYHERSHGEGFFDLLGTRRFHGPGFFVFDEPESGLSFSAQLRLLVALLDLVADGRSQVLVATHSPVLAAVPGAALLELDADGMHQRSWEELELVDHHRRFLTSPDSYLRHLT